MTIHFTDLPPAVTAMVQMFVDLAGELPHAVRLQRMVELLRTQLDCDAVALLRLEEDTLRPVAVCGLVPEALQRRFSLAHNPRLATVLARHEVTSFEHDSHLPEPFDGLLDALAGKPLPVHDCMGVSLHLNGQPWGVLTFESLDLGRLGGDARQRVAHCVPLVEAVIRIARLEQDLRALRLAATSAGGLHRGDLAASPAEPGLDELEIVGESPALQRLLHELGVVAQSQLPVLLLGETGVGKELFARLLHQRSPRHARALVHVNCAALPESLAETELFGHVRGAFSGAVSDRAGRFEAAEGGTLFLDEVGELPLAVQAKLLRTLQNGEIQRLGADRPRRVDVRVIAATNRNLHEQVASGAFRADLYHRLSVYPVPIPPLRERGADVLLLAWRFLELNRARLGLRGLRLSPQAQAALRDYRWPGNVRELEHVISRATLKSLSRGANPHAIITLEAALLDLDPVDTAPATPALEPASARAEAAAASAPPPLASTLRDAVDSCQRQAITAALDLHQGNWSQAAQRLDVDPSNLHKLARRLGLKPGR
ncbi:nitric oxide reductase transcriptional regulator NorR [Comamonas faecalis]|uniref:Nitric oxide reductase transcriptional regulator NorR n=1 Tax=Comamonas faecalis TaxID=1387849 RepID=A0ABP7QN45_9BURK